MKRILLLLMVTIFIIALFIGCTGNGQIHRYRSDFMDTFDTVVTVVAYAPSDAAFDEMLALIHSTYTDLHKQFDIYHNYDGINNVKTINDNAGTQPVKVGPHIIELIKFSKDWHAKTNGTVNIALGPVLSIWRDYRETGIEDPQHAQLPPLAELEAANAHTNIDNIIIDEEASTVYLADKHMRLDVGAVAKGYTTEVVAKLLMEAGYDSVLISAGGNVRAIGGPMDSKRKKWGVGIKDPESPLAGSTDEQNLLDVAFVTDLSVVSSGVYERFYVVGERQYHHLINPETLMPGDYYRAVTVITEDSALADLLSTALFLMPPEDSLEYVKNLEGVEAIWVMPDNELIYSPGIKPLLRDLGGATST